MIHYKVKEPKFNNTKCETLLYVDKDGNKVTKPKRKFETHDAAVEECKKLNAQPHRIHKLVTYKCKTCQKYHIGRNGKLIKRK